MHQPAQALAISVDDYLDGELHSEIRHEYVAGAVFAMAGAGEAHNRISLNLAFHLRAATRGTPCGVFMSDMKVRVRSHEAFYYPDVLLTCDPNDRESLYKTEPCLIAEVLSPGTELTDRREKLIAYRSLRALKTYLLIAQDQRRVERYQRTLDGSWRYEVIEDGTISIDCAERQLQVAMPDLYEDVVLEVPE